MHKKTSVLVTLLFSASCVNFSLRAPSSESGCYSSSEDKNTASPTTTGLLDILSWPVLRRTLEFIPEKDGPVVRSVSEDFSCVYNDIPGHQPFMTLPSLPSHILDIKFCSNSKSLVVLGEEQINIFRLDDENGLWKCSHIMPLHEQGRLHNFAISPDGETIALEVDFYGPDADFEGILIFSFDKRRNLWACKGLNSRDIEEMAFSSNGNTLVMGNFTGKKIKVFARNLEGNWARHGRIKVGKVNSVKSFHDSQNIFITVKNGPVYVLDCTTRKIIQKIPCIPNSYVQNLAYIPDGIKAITSHLDDLEACTAKIWQFDASKNSWLCIGEIDRDLDCNRYLYSAEFAADGTQVFSCQQHNCIARIWDLKSRHIKDEFKLPHQIRCAALSPNGKWFTVLQDNNELRMYPVPSAEE